MRSGKHTPGGKCSCGRYRHPECKQCGAKTEHMIAGKPKRIVGLVCPNGHEFGVAA